MNEITLGRCAPDVLLSHLALYGLAAILDAEGITGVHAAWTQDSDQRPVISAPGLTGEQAAQAIAGDARRAHDAASWLHRPITLKGSSRAPMSPRLTAFADEATWQHAQQQRHTVLDELTAARQWLDLRFLQALGEPCYWVRDGQDRIQQDNAASRLEMQPRNIGSEFIGNRLRKLAAAVAARDTTQIASGLLGQTVRDEAGGDAADSRSATGLAAPGPTDNAVAWCALWGISQLPLAMRVPADPRIPTTAATTGHLGRSRNEWSTPRSGKRHGGPPGPAPSSPPPRPSPSRAKDWTATPGNSHETAPARPPRWPPEAKSPPPAAGLPTGTSPASSASHREIRKRQRTRTPGHARPAHHGQGRNLSIRPQSQPRRRLQPGALHRGVKQFPLGCEPQFVATFNQAALHRGGSAGNVRVSRETSRRL